MSEKLKVVVVGLGNFGHSWATSVVPSCRDEAILAAVVDQRQERWEGIDPAIPRFRSLDEALDAMHPDLVVNVTPPAAHNEINKTILEKGIPVLCEKPIADSLDAAARMGQILKETGGFLMIGENYRYHGVFRALKAVLQSGRLGSLRQMNCHFRHHHSDYSMFYHGTLPHPLLQDVTIHHLDLARYLSGEEPVNVWCREYSAPYCWYGQRPATAHILSDMTNGSVFHYSGTLSSPQSTTTWNGDWELQCDSGVAVIRNDRVYLYQNDEIQEITPAAQTEESRIPMLIEACRAIKAGVPGETDYWDNLRSFRWMQYAIQSSQDGKVIAIDMKEDLQ